MINIDELWIGDWVKVKSSGIHGQYHGNHQGIVTIKTKDHQLVTVASADLEKTNDEVESIQDTYSIITHHTEEISSTEDDFGDTIDLHYEILILSYPHSNSSKLEYQLEICTRFIQSAIESKLLNIQIIHGRGQGILKNEVERLLKQYSEITIISSNPNLASVDAWMNYH